MGRIVYRQMQIKDTVLRVHVEDRSQLMSSTQIEGAGVSDKLSRWMLQKVIKIDNLI